MEDLTLTVYIADRPYRLKVRQDEVEIVKNAVKEIEEKIKGYADSYAFNDRQDLLAMTALHFATMIRKKEEDRTGIADERLVEKLKYLNSLL